MTKSDRKGQSTIEDRRAQGVDARLAATCNAPQPEVSCVYCHQPVQMVTDGAFDDLLCPSCGGSFRVEADSAEPLAAGNLTQLGKFELTEVVGRGGFGTVYRARDTVLQRTVAIKVPRHGQWSTPGEEDRFVREARNVAQLQHSGIVSVFEVGRGDTLPYIVSEFVEGTTLADALRAHPFKFDEAARLIAQVAEALDHAHRHGVVHRDLKPANIMLTPDGTPRVMDFGLAKRDAGEVTMTIDGQVLGTPAYMSPEQASGQGHHVDGRSDVYSMGSILYELLTGELPFRGNQRMLLHQVMHDEPRALRSLNDRIPRDLETICLKAMSKDPGRRYPSAQAMSEDLTRHLNGKPILARPVGQVARGWQWAKRNRGLAILSGSMLLLLLSVAVGSTIAAIRIDRAHTGELAARQTADATAARERVAREEAEAAQQRAEEGFRRAREAVDSFYTRISENRLLNTPGLQPLRHELLKEALAYYRGFAIERATDASVQAELQITRLRVASIAHTLGDMATAEEISREAVRVGETLVRDQPSVLEHQKNLALSYNTLAVVEGAAGRTTQAQELYRKGLAVRQRIAESQPEVPEHQTHLAWSYNNLAIIAAEQGQHAEAEGLYVQGLKIRDQLVRQHPGVLEYERDLAYLANNLALLQSNMGRPTEAEALHRKALAIWQRLADEHADVVDHRRNLALSYNNLARLKSTTADAEAVDLFGKGLKIWQDLARNNPDVVEYRSNLAWSYYSLANLRQNAGQRDEARTLYRQALDIAEPLAQKYPAVLEYQRDAAAIAGDFASLRGAMGETSGAEELYRKSLAILERVSTENPADMSWRIDMLRLCDDLALLQSAAGNKPQALATYERAVKVYDEMPQTPARSKKAQLAAAYAYAGIATLWAFDGVGTGDAVANAGDTAVKMMPQNPVTLLIHGAVLVRQDRHDDAKRELARAVELAATTDDSGDSHVRAHRIRAMAEALLAVVCHQAADPAGAKEHLTAAEQSLAELGKIDEASDALNPQHSWGVDIKQLISQTAARLDGAK